MTGRGELPRVCFGRWLIASAACLLSLSADASIATTNSPAGQMRRAARPGEVTVVPVHTADLAEIERVVRESGGRVLGRSGVRSAPNLRIRADEATLTRLGTLSSVRWMENVERKVLHNDVAAGVLGVTNVWPQADLETLGLTGRGQLITTSDSGIDTGDLSTLHADLTNAVVGFAVYEDCHHSDTNGHGTHTAGSLVGDGTRSGGQYRGMAHGAKLWAWFCDSGEYLNMPNKVDELFSPTNCRPFGTPYIHSASWGGENCEYNSYSQSIDRYCWDHPDFLPVFSAGNAGTAGSVSSEGSSKNVLTVGATESARGGWPGGWSARYPNKIASFSSRGPTTDGRIKPDVVAPGTGIYSTRSSELGEGGYYQYMAGTSMSCPLTAGCAALVREWLVGRRGLPNPSAALVKAILMGGAIDLFGRTDTNVTMAAPNSQQGWGRVNLAESLAPADGRDVYLADYIPYHTKTNVVFELTTTNDAPLDVQLVWIDYPGTWTKDTPATMPMLVNNLDLKVVRAGEEMSPRWGNGGTSPDTLNNVESVRFAVATAGTYRVTVSGTDIPHPSEEGGAAALYIRGAFDPAAVSVTTSGLPRVTLTIRSDSPGDRLADPACGVQAYDEGAVVTVLADDWSVVFGPDKTASARYPFVGFTGTGSVPAQGTTNAVTFTILEDSTINWIWDAAHPEYRYQTFLRLYGYADNVRKGMRRTYVEYDRYFGWPYQLTDTWIASNVQFTVKLPEDIARDPFQCTGYHSTNNWATYERGDWTYRFAQAFYCRTDEELYYLYSDATGSPWTEFEITMDEGCDIVLDYYEANDCLDVADNQTWAPTWWILRYLWWYDIPGGIDASAAADPDGDGFSNEAEYRVGTQPLDAASSLRFTAMTPTGLCWRAGAEVPQVLERRETFDAAWRPVFTNASGEVDAHYPVSNSSTGVFYRLTVPRNFQR